MNRLLSQLQFLQHPRVFAIMRYTGYVLFFLFVLILAVPLTFPTRQLKSYVSRQAAAQGYPLEIDELSLWGLGGVEIGGLRLTLPGKKGEPTGDGPAPRDIPDTELRFDKITARVALFPALFGKTIDVTFDVEAGGGTIQGGHLVRKGNVLDFEIERIENLSLADMGAGGRILDATKKVSGELDGALSGGMKVHWGGSPEDLVGQVDLQLGDTTLRGPELALEGGLRMTDLAMGTVTIRIRMNLKSQIATLASQRGSDKATVIHIEQLESVGDQLELVTEETSHILIPPGKAGFKAATIKLHFAFALPDKPAGGKEGAAAGKPADDRLKWASLLTMAGGKLKPFQRNGYIGITCTGLLSRPQCKPDLPQVSVGTRQKSDGSPKVGGDKPADGRDAGTEPTAEPGDQRGSDDPVPPPVEYQPAVRPEPVRPEPPPEPTPPPETPTERSPGGEPPVAPTVTPPPPPPSEESGAEPANPAEGNARVRQPHRSQRGEGSDNGDENPPATEPQEQDPNAPQEAPNGETPAPEPSAEE